MDLLGKEIPQKQSKGKKTVLMLIILSIILLVISVVAIFLLQSNKTKTLKLNVNGKDAAIQQNMFISNNETTYISLQSVANLVGYDYIKGGYLDTEENKNKAYIENINDVIEYEANSNKIQKIDRTFSTEGKNYNLKHKIIINNDILYIALEDLNIGCNVVYNFSPKDNKIIINTTEVLVEAYNTDFTSKNLKVNNSVNNQKAFLYNMIVVSNETGKMGVVDGNSNSLIGYKYDTMEFNEYLQKFIVSSNGKYGIISKEGRLIIELKYEGIEIISYSPLLYKVKLNGKYGVIEETGKIVTSIEYDKIGFSENSNLTEPVCIIKNINNGNDGIVVCKDNKYGISDMKTGEMVIECEVDKIYTKVSDVEDIYYIEFKNRELELNRYIEYVKSVATNVTN